LHFFDTEKDHDRLVIIDEEAIDGVILKEVSGKGMPKIPISSNSVVRLIFTTDGDTSENGFNLTYEAGETA
jgi:hypothetical protein